jgi:hypothetical protein
METMTSKTRLSYAFGGLLVSALAWPAVAVADGPSEAQRLFEEARILADNGRWTEACPRLAESQRLEPNMTTQFRLADCYEHTGRTASAWVNYTAAAKAAAAAGQTAKERFAIERASKLEPTIDKLLIVVPGEAPTDLQIERDGRQVPQAQWNTPLPVDPGEHTVHVWAPGKSSYDALVTVSGTGETRRLEVPALEPALPWRLSSEAQVKPLIIPQAPTAAPDTTVTPEHRGSAWRTVGWALGGVGIGALAVGGALYGAEATRADPCSGNRCVPPVTLLGTGALLAAVGAVIIVVTAP